MSEAELRKKILLAQLTLVEEKIKTEREDRAVKEKLNQLLERKIKSFDAIFNQQTHNAPESTQQSTSDNNIPSVIVTEVGQDNESDQRIMEEEDSDNEYSKSDFFN